MMATINLTFISAFLLALLIGCSASETGDITKLNQVTNKFALNLYKEVKHPSGNTILSPIGLHLLLNILLTCANGTTAAEIASVLQHEAGDQRILNGYKQFLEERNNEISSFKLAAAVAVDSSFPVLEAFHYEKDLREYFKSEILRFDFKHLPNFARVDLNNWVHKKTEGQIENLLPDGSIDHDTEVVMVSGIHFKGIWKHKFNKKNTELEPFHIKPNVTVNVKMMGISGSRFRYMWNSNLGVQIVELPYTEEDFRMIIILPQETFGLAELEKKMTYENLVELISSLRETNVDVFLPRFKIKRSIKLVNILKKMGMPTAFSQQADFSKLTNDSILVSNVIQKAMIVVNEKGSRAAAGSGIVISAKTLPPQMVCNSPFMYMILKGDTILFIGSFLKP